MLSNEYWMIFKIFHNGEKRVIAKEYINI